MEPSDEALVQSCRRGDAAAWEMLITRYQRLLYSIPRRAGLDEDQCAEVFQHVFQKLIEKLNSIEQPERIKAWLVTTAQREAWRLKRYERAVGSLIGGDDQSEDSDNDTPDDMPLPDELIVRLEEQQQVRSALAELDDRCRKLLTLLFYRLDTPSYAEIATTLHMTESSIGPTRARCLQKLHRLLNVWGF